MQRLAARTVLEEEAVVAARVGIVVRARGGHEVDVLLVRVKGELGLGLGFGFELGPGLGLRLGLGL